MADGFGWETLKSVFRDYELDEAADAALPTSEQEEKDAWLVRFSRTCGHDMREFMVDYWGLEVSAAALHTTEDLGLPTWMPAMGGLTSLTVKYGKSVTFDLTSSTLSLDGVAIVNFDVDQGSPNGSITDNSDGTFTYAPSSGFTDIDFFSYSVTATKYP